METVRRSVVPSAAVLVLAALTERLGADTATFYLFLAGIVLSATAGLMALGRTVDGEPHGPARLEASLSALLVLVFCIGAAARSPILLEVGGPGLVPAAVLLGLFLLALLALAAAAPARR